MALPLSFNVDVLKTRPGILKLLEIIVTSASLIVIEELGVYDIPEFFVDTVECSFRGNVAILCTTGLLFISCLISPVTASNLPKTVYEFLYHVCAFIFFMVLSLVMLVYTFKDMTHDGHFVVALIESLLNVGSSILYLMSSYCSYQTLKSEGLTTMEMR